MLVRLKLKQKETSNKVKPTKPNQTNEKSQPKKAQTKNQAKNQKETPNHRAVGIVAAELIFPSGQKNSLIMCIH